MNNKTLVVLLVLLAFIAITECKKKAPVITEV